MNESLEFDSDSVRMFCKDHLGPASAAFVQQPSIQKRIVNRMAKKTSVRDAVLAEVFRMAKEDQKLAGEFIGFFWKDVLRLTRGKVPPNLRRQLETADVVDSILGDLCMQLSDLEFYNRAAFLSLLSTKFRQKLANKVRGTKAQKRREDQRVFPNEQHWEPESPAASPDSEVSNAETLARLNAAIYRLRPREQQLLRLAFAGKSISEIAEEVDLKTEAARKVVERAREKLKQLLYEP
ncbi:MAG: sigma-70 family RNA polymerase sigma factor [Planctomycetota bacterium]|nr:MAG: sigma-70 family RNA polymerase sigma factor [Planctomycetota bacterium]